MSTIDAVTAYKLATKCNRPLLQLLQPDMWQKMQIHTAAALMEAYRQGVVLSEDRHAKAIATLHKVEDMLFNCVCGIEKYTIWQWKNLVEEIREVLAPEELKIVPEKPEQVGGDQD